MALMQVIAVGDQDRNLREGRAAKEFITQLPEGANLAWNSRQNYTLHRAADVIEKVNLQIKVGAAPQGYRWKRLWPLSFIKRLDLSIGGQIIWSTTSAALHMKYLIDGLRITPDWLSAFPDATPEALRTSKESIFDYTDPEERSRLSRRAQEVFFEPLALKELIASKYPIPIISLAFHEVRVMIETASQDECLEHIEGEVALPAEVVLEECNIVSEMTFLDTQERRELAQGRYEFQTKHNNYCSEIFEKGADNKIQTYIRGDLLCSAAYIWITDENGAELPEQVVESMSVLFNGQQRENLSGHMARFAVRQQLPHRTVENNKSQNLYYISYFPGRREANGMEQGVNLSRIDSYSMKFQLNATAPQSVKIHMIHRVQNTLNLIHGIAGLRFVNIPYFLQAAPVIQDARAAPAATKPTEFPNTDQLIDIPNDETACMITYNDFKEGDVVQQCLQCRKIFGSDVLERWMTERPRNQKCIHCQQAYNTNTFRKGKAHLLAVGEEAALLPRPAPAPPQEGFVGRVLAAVGLGRRPHED